MLEGMWPRGAQPEWEGAPQLPGGVRGVRGGGDPSAKALARLSTGGACPSWAEVDPAGGALAAGAGGAPFSWKPHARPADPHQGLL